MAVDGQVHGPVITSLQHVADSRLGKKVDRALFSRAIPASQRVMDEEDEEIMSKKRPL